ncbi:MAG: FmdB family zinc ribbon protein [Nocardioides sp.]
MPTYQYACTECAHTFEQFQSFSDDALTECPQCTGRLRKLFNAVGVVFKGSGFYRNDSRSTTTPTEGAAPAAPATDKPAAAAPTEKKSGSAEKSSTPAAAS